MDSTYFRAAGSTSKSFKSLGGGIAKLDVGCVGRLAWLPYS